MNRQPYFGNFARCKADEIIIDSRYPSGIKDNFVEFILQYKNYSIIEQDLSTMPEITNLNVNSGTGYIRHIPETRSGTSGYTFYAGIAAMDNEAEYKADRSQLYSAFVAEQPAILSTMIHEWGHGIGLGHEDNSYRWVKFKNQWRNQQSYFYGNLSAGGFMAYGGKKFNPADDFGVKHILGLNPNAGTVSGTVSANGSPLKGANIIFIDINRKFTPSIRSLPERHSVIVDMLGVGDGSFYTPLPVGEYRVMIVPIGNYSRKTHGEWFLADSQIKNLAKPYFLNQKNIFAAKVSNKKILKVTAGASISLNTEIRI